MATSSTQAVPETRDTPQHVAIIMDGNGRWATRRLLPGGTRQGVQAVRRVVEACGRAGVRYLTLFAFSSENWRRPAEEVSLLMRLFVQALEREVGKLEEQGVRLHVIGDLSAFEPRLQELIFAAQQRTAHNDRLHLTVAANYGGRWDILQATRAMLAAEPDLAAHPERIDEAHLSRHLSMSWAPEPDLFIRTGGEQRISNFLIWQMAYAEFYFTDRYWPDFGAAELQAAFDWYRTRERRFGRTSAQVNGDDRNRPPSARLSGQHKRRPSHVGPAYRYRRYSVGHPGRRHDERQSLVVRRPARAGRGLRQWEWLRLTLPQPPSPLICAGVPVLLFAAMLALSSAWLGGAGPGWADPRWILGYAAPAVAAVWLFGGVTAVVRGHAPRQPGLVAVSVPAAFVAWAVLADVHRARRGVRGVAAGAGLGGRYRRLFCRPRVRQA